MDALAVVGAVASVVQLFRYASNVLRIIRHRKKEIIDVQNAASDLSRLKKDLCDANPVILRPSIELYELYILEKGLLNLRRELEKFFQGLPSNRENVHFSYDSLCYRLRNKTDAFEARAALLPKLKASLSDRIKERHLQHTDFHSTSRYCKEELIGKGAQGEVHKVYTDGYEDMSAAFLREVKIMECLSASEDWRGRYVVKLVSWHRDDAACEYQFAMVPLAMDGNLETLISRQCYSTYEIITRDILRTAWNNLTHGVAFIHEQSIRHKDIKPENILYHEGHFLYADFGISLQFDPLPFAAGTTQTKDPQYSHVYASPEVRQRRPRNTKSDVFSLGCVLFELLAARAVVLAQTFESRRPTVYEEGARGFSYLVAEGEIAMELARWENHDRLNSLVPYIEIIKDMLGAKLEDRSDAAEIADRIDRVTG